MHWPPSGIYDTSFTDIRTNSSMNTPPRPTAGTGELVMSRPIFARERYMDIIDLRSDTITTPTDAMRQAMSKAQVGDDVFGEDPTVNRLEEMAAQKLGKQAAILVPSGTMANLICVLNHCQRGDEMILGDQAHIFFYEQGGSAALGGVHPRIVPNQPDGKISPAHIQAAIRADDVHLPRTRLIALENTHNRCNGFPLEPEYLDQIRAMADAHGLKIHVDGARIFNAAAALGTDPKELARPADSICFCLSKGLGAPVGSLVCGDADFVKNARRYRKVLGGGMRQAGILAAAGIVALEQMVDRLPEDHANAKYLAEGMSEIPGIGVNPDMVRTNIVFFAVTRPDMDARAAVSALAQEGVKVLASGPRLMRAVTQHLVDRKDMDQALKIMARVFA